MILFKERVELADEAEQWMEENHVAKTPLSVITYLEAKGRLRGKNERWIPCNERIPKPKNKDQRRGYYLTTNGYGSVGVTRYEFYDDFQKTGWQSDIRINAWQDLPEAWKGEQNNGCEHDFRSY